MLKNDSVRLLLSLLHWLWVKCYCIAVATLHRRCVDGSFDL